MVLTTMENIDKDDLKNYLRNYCDRELEPGHGKYRKFYICPFCNSGAKANGSPAFHLFDNDRRYKCSSCGETGDIYTLAMYVERITFIEALKFINDLYGTPGSKPTLLQKKKQKHEQPINIEPVIPSQEWQSCLMPIVERAKETIFEDTGKEAREYLFSRKIDEQTICDYGLGFIPAVTKSSYLVSQGTAFTIKTPFQNSKYPDLWIPFGITFPYFMDGKLCKLETRRTPSQLKLMSDYMKPDKDGIKGNPDKNGFVTGWKPSLFNADDALCQDKRRDIIFTEGVIDALSINQTVGRWCNDEIKAVSFGACTIQGDPDEFYKWYVMPYRIIVGFDNDDAGDANSKTLLKKINMARRHAGRTEAIRKFPPSEYKDWNEFLMKDERTVFKYISDLFPVYE